MSPVFARFLLILMGFSWFSMGFPEILRPFKPFEVDPGPEISGHERVPQPLGAGAQITGACSVAERGATHRRGEQRPRHGALLGARALYQPGGRTPPQLKL